MLLVLLRRELAARESLPEHVQGRVRGRLVRMPASGRVPTSPHMSGAREQHDREQTQLLGKRETDTDGLGKEHKLSLHKQTPREQ